MKNDKYLLLLGANQFQRERALIGAEIANHSNIITVSADAPFIKDNHSLYTLKSIETDPQQLLKDVINFITLNNITLSAVIPLNDFVLNSGLAIAQHFNLPYNHANTIEICRKKDKMKNTLIKAGLPVVKSIPFYDYQEAVVLAQEIGYPVVIKPLNFGGSGGVKKIDHANELEKSILESRKHLEQYAKNYNADSTCLLIEPYITLDREISVEVINTPDFREVIGITEKYLGPQPYFSEIAHTVPSPLDDANEKSLVVKNLALNACKALNIQFGMAHVEIKISRSGDQAIIVEVGARTAGDGIMDLYEKVTGVNMYTLHCLSYLKLLTLNEIPRSFTKAAAIGYLHPNNNGIVKKIKKDTLHADLLKNVDSIIIKANSGDEIFPARNWSTRYGFVTYSFEKCFPAEFNVIETTKSIADQLFEMEKYS